MASYTDYLWTSTGGAVTILGGLWVRLHNNNTGTDYYSSAVTDASTGAFTHSAPTGDYSLYSGTAATVPGTPNLRNGHYAVAARSGDDPAFNSATVVSSPYAPSSAAGTIDNDYWMPPPSGDATGVTDTAAMQAILTAVRVAGGGRVNMQRGTYQVNLGVHPNGAGPPTYYVGLMVGAKTTLIGAGRDATVIQLVANQTHGFDTSTDKATVLMNYNIAAGGDEQISLQDFTVDGNNVNQTHTQGGISVMRTRGVRMLRVRVTNCRGTANGGVNETFGIESQLGTDTSYTDCECLGTAGSTATGFSDDNASNIKYENCIAFGLSVGHGFTHNTCQNIQYVNCHSYLNGTYGFNSEVSQDVVYLGCIAGGLSTATTTYPYATSTSLGNVNNGFSIASSTNVVVDNCTSRKNANGLVATTAGPIRINGGDYSSNTSYCFIMADVASATSTAISGRPIVSGNTLQINPGSHTYPNLTGFQTPVGTDLNVPANNVAFTNPFPYDMTAFVIPGASTCFVQIGGNATGVMLANAGLAMGFRVLAGQTITLTYTAAPTWNWFAG